jgi:ribonucleoside-diphosphate reductase alpha chain
MTTAGLGSDAMGSLSLMMTETTTFGATALSSGTVVLDERAKAKLQGYTGDSCGECGHFMMVRNGSCLKCQSCGATTGCS